MAAFLVQFVLISAIQLVYSLPEQGKWHFDMDQENHFAAVTKSMYNMTPIAVTKLECKSDPHIKVRVKWLLRYSPCAEEYIGMTGTKDKTRSRYYLNYPDVDQVNYGYKEVEFIQWSSPKTYDCTKDGNLIILENTESSRLKKIPAIPVVDPQTEKNTTASSKSVTEKSNETPKVLQNQTNKKRSRRAAGDETSANQTLTTVKSNVTMQQAADDTNQINPSHIVVKTWRDGIFLFVLSVEPAEKLSDSKFTVSADVTIKGPNGFLSAIDWPLLPFYGIMCIVYVVYGIVWLVLLACNWKDLLRIQFWIGGVIVLGMLEKAVFFAEYETINNTGKSVRGAVVFAELISCLKRTVARMLVIIVSLGFGIVKPRLGPMLNKVISVGALFFIFGSVEGCLRVLSPKGDTSNKLLLSSIPLAITDAFICWWVFTSLVQTTRTLRLRRNIVKLSLYRHFTNTLIFAVLASVAFMIWSIKQHKLSACITDWKEIWVDDAYWHLLFSVILMVIMILWRPTINNQRYAFSPLLDQAEDEQDEEPLMNDAFDGMKMRGLKGQSNGSPKQKDSKSKVEEDLKWIEENIPQSVADSALPSLLDSDEEIMTTKFEMSKME